MFVYSSSDLLSEKAEKTDGIERLIIKMSVLPTRLLMCNPIPIKIHTHTGTNDAYCRTQ